MAEYTHRIDESISQLLSQRGRVTPDMIAGFDEAEAADLLRRYVEIHGHEVPLVFDSGVMTWANIGSETHASMPSSMLTPSPVDQVLAMDTSRSLLDTPAASGKVNSMLWMLPLTLALPGGVLGWFLTRETNKPVARAMLWVGVLMTVMTVVSTMFAMPMLKNADAGLGGKSVTTSWPPSKYERPAFYYFGDPADPVSVQMTPLVQGLSRDYIGRVDFVLYSDLNNDAEGSLFAQDHAIQGMPSMVLVDAKGAEVERWLGGQSAEALKIAIDGALKK